MKKEKNKEKLFLIIIAILVLGFSYFIMWGSGEGKCAISKEGLEEYRERFLSTCNGLNKNSEIINLQSEIINLLDVNNTYPSPDESFPIFDCNKLLEEIDRQATQK